MRWLVLMNLDDGTRVESSMPMHDTLGALNGPWYRVSETDGRITEFVSMTSILSYLHRRWGL
jgi:hypothetical protein